MAADVAVHSFVVAVADGLEALFATNVAVNEGRKNAIKMRSSLILEERYNKSQL